MREVAPGHYGACHFMLDRPVLAGHTELEERKSHA